MVWLCEPVNETRQSHGRLVDFVNVIRCECSLITSISESLDPQFNLCQFSKLHQMELDVSFTELKTNQTMHVYFFKNFVMIR